MKNWIVALATLLSAQTIAKTQLSQLVDYVQKTYASQFKDYPILIFDIDELEYRYAEAGVFGKGKELEKKRAAIIKDYVFEKIGLELEHSETMTLEPYTSLLKNSAFALPLLDRSGGWSKVEYKMCAIFTATANSNQRLETERITGMNTEGAYEDITYSGLQEKMTYKEMQMFSIYHELGHCMDRFFMPNMYNTYEVDPHDVHEAESFAEVFGLMMIEREGYKGTAKTRALLRNMYTQEMSKWFIANPQNSFGDPLYLKGGLIYYLTPPLLAAGEFLKRKGSFVQGSVEDIMVKAKEITQEHALRGQSFAAIAMSMEMDKGEVFENYRDWATDNPSFFMKSYRDLVHFHDYSPYLLDKIVGDTPDDNSGEELDELNPAEFCSLEKGDVLEYVDSKRQELRQAGLSYASQEVRQAQLNSFFESYANCL